AALLVGVLAGDVPVVVVVLERLDVAGLELLAQLAERDLVGVALRGEERPGEDGEQQDAEGDQTPPRHAHVAAALGRRGAVAAGPRSAGGGGGWRGGRLRAGAHASMLGAGGGHPAGRIPDAAGPWR